MTKGFKVEDFIGTSSGNGSGILVDQLISLEKVKEPIKKAKFSSLAKREAIKQIESKSERTIHFIFETK